MRTPIKLLAIEQFDERLPDLQRAAQLFRDGVPREGWIHGIRKSLGISMRNLSSRLGLKEHKSVQDLERNERTGAVTLLTLRRAAEALDAEFVYAIVPRKKLREILRARALEVARQRIAPITKSMALEEQGLTAAQTERQIEELALELERKPEMLWR